MSNRSQPSWVDEHDQEKLTPLGDAEAFGASNSVLSSEYATRTFVSWNKSAQEDVRIQLDLILSHNGICSQAISQADNKSEETQGSPTSNSARYLLSCSISRIAWYLQTIIVLFDAATQPDGMCIRRSVESDVSDITKDETHWRRYIKLLQRAGHGVTASTACMALIREFGGVYLMCDNIQSGIPCSPLITRLKAEFENAPADNNFGNNTLSPFFKCLKRFIDSHNGDCQKLFHSQFDEVSLCRFHFLDPEEILLSLFEQADAAVGMPQSQEISDDKPDDSTSTTSSAASDSNKRSPLIVFEGVQALPPRLLSALKTELANHELIGIFLSSASSEQPPAAISGSKKVRFAV